MIYSLVEYINSKGRIAIKATTSEEDERKFVELLDKRIERGTCGGYITTTCNIAE